MAPASTGLHEPADQLAPETIDRHRAIVSLIEELHLRRFTLVVHDARAAVELRYPGWGKGRVRTRPRSIAVTVGAPTRAMAVRSSPVRMSTAWRTPGAPAAASP